MKRCALFIALIGIVNESVYANNINSCSATSTIKCSSIQDSGPRSSPCQNFIQEFHETQKPAGIVCNATSKANVLKALTKLNDGYYFFSTDTDEKVRRNWYGASDYCKSRGMELVTIETEAENKALEQKVKDYFGPLKPGYAGIYWIGLNDLGKEGEFRWASTGKEADFTHWFPNEPSNKGYQNQPENCASVDTITTGTGWNDLDCTAEHYFICELQ